MGQRFFKVKARTLDEAYAKLRKQFGDDAVVLGTHQVTEGGVLGLFAKRMVEVTAAVPADAVRPGPPRKQSPAERAYSEQSVLQTPVPTMGSASPNPAGDRNVAHYEQILREAHARMHGGGPAASAQPQAQMHQPPPAARAAMPSGGASPVLPFPSRAPDPESASGVSRELQEIREMVQVLYSEHPGAGLPAEFAPHYRTLVERGVSRKVAAGLVAAVAKNSDLEIIRDGRVFLERLHFEIRRIIRVTGGIALQPGRRRIVALCGPTGVGKTTNLAKLAAHYAVRERARVGLITADSYRIAAPEQLRTYANIIGVPMRVVNDPAELSQALADFQGFDLVLLDTAGGSQFNLEQINELKGVLAAARPHETLLVLPAGGQLADTRSVVSNFKCLNPTSLMFTKLDETNSYGAVLSLLAESGLPLSYVSVGQSVPDDIRPVTPGLIANLILEGRRYAG